MTLNDLFLLLKRYLKWVIIVPLACAVLAGGLVVAKNAGKAESYSATATLTVTDPTNSLSATNLTLQLNATAQNVVTDLSTDDVKVVATVDDKTQSVALSAASSSAEKAEASANEAAQEVVESMQDALSAQAEVFKREGSIPADGQLATDQNAANVKAAALEACVYTIAPAQVASNTASSSAVKYAAVGLVGGLFAVVLVLALYDSVKRPIKTRQDIAQVTDLPVLNGNGGPSGVELVRASLLTACNGAPGVVCVVSQGNDGVPFAEQLQAAFSAASENVEVKLLAPLAEDAKGYFDVQKADATLMYVGRWEATASGLTASLEELKLAKANVAGIVLA